MNAMLLKIRIANGETVEQIAAEFGVSVRRVYQIIGPQKGKPYIDDAKAEEVRRLHRLGRSNREIASELAMSRDSVGKIVGRQERPNQPLSGEEIETIRRRAAAGHDAAAIARDLDRSGAAVRDALERMEREDWIRDLVIARAKELGMNATAIAAATGERVRQDRLAAYMAGEQSISSWMLQWVFQVLKLGLKQE